MSNAEIERLGLLIEELAEAQKVAGKILRFGYENCNPNARLPRPNRSLLEEEIGHVLHAVGLMYGNDISEWGVKIAKERKRVTVKPWLRYQA